MSIKNEPKPLCVRVKTFRNWIPAADLSYKATLSLRGSKIRGENLIYVYKSRLALPRVLTGDAVGTLVSHCSDNSFRKRVIYLRLLHSRFLRVHDQMLRLKASVCMRSPLDVHKKLYPWLHQLRKNQCELTLITYYTY